MLKKENGQLTWFEFPLLQHISYIKHGCFSRKGGISPPPFSSLNIQLFPEELFSSVQENKARIQKVLSAKEPLVDLTQVHGIQIAIVREPPKMTPLGQFDALATNLPGIPLTIKHADCQACLMVDPTLKVIAAIHCGWRGNVQNIYEKVVQKLISEFGSKPENLLACISPSLGPCHAEFTNWAEDFPKNFWKYNKQNYFNLWEIAHEQLTSAGITNDHIEIAQICTFEDRENFFSFRREGLTGRNGTCIMLT